MVIWPAIPSYSQCSGIIRHYTKENGLLSNGIKGIELDKTSLAANCIYFIAKNREGSYQIPPTQIAVDSTSFPFLHFVRYKSCLACINT
jgi:hypothetical protein